MATFQYQEVIWSMKHHLRKGWSDFLAVQSLLEVWKKKGAQMKNFNVNDLCSYVVTWAVEKEKPEKFWPEWDLKPCSALHVKLSGQLRAGHCMDLW